MAPQQQQTDRWWRYSMNPASRLHSLNLVKTGSFKACLFSRDFFWFFLISWCFGAWCVPEGVKLSLLLCHYCQTENAGPFLTGDCINTVFIWERLPEDRCWTVKHDVIWQQTPEWRNLLLNVLDWQWSLFIWKTSAEQPFFNQAWGQCLFHVWPPLDWIKVAVWGCTVRIRPVSMSNSWHSVERIVFTDMRV